MRLCSDSHKKVIKKSIKSNRFARNEWKNVYRLPQPVLKQRPASFEKFQNIIPKELTTHQKPNAFYGGKTQDTQNQTA